MSFFFVLLGYFVDHVVDTQPLHNTECSILPTALTAYNCANSIKDQIAVARTSDILFGMHGAGLTHILWLPAHAVVLEVRNKFVLATKTLFIKMEGASHLV